MYFQVVQNDCGIHHRGQRHQFDLANPNRAAATKFGYSHEKASEKDTVQADEKSTQQAPTADEANERQMVKTPSGSRSPPSRCASWEAQMTSGSRPERGSRER